MSTTEIAIRAAIEDSELPDNDQWTNRFEVRSESSDRIYIVSQHKAKRHWGCSCPAWRTRRKCKHLVAVGLPVLEKPHEIGRIG